MFADFFLVKMNKTSQICFVWEKQLIEALSRDAFKDPGKVQDRQPGS